MSTSLTEWRRGASSPIATAALALLLSACGGGSVDGGDAAATAEAAHSSKALNS